MGALSFKRIIKFGWTNFVRNRGLAAVSIFIITVTTLLVSSLFLYGQAGSSLVDSLENKADISAYFKDNASEEDILAIKEALAEIAEVKDVEYASKEEALAEFTRRHRNDPVLVAALDEIGGNPFLASLNVKAWQANQYESIVDFLQKEPFGSLIEKVDYFDRKLAIDRIFSIGSMVNNAGIFLSAILIILAVAAAFNIIRLTIYSLREEIRVQRLVGASNWFIRGPFLVQGAISGMFAFLISLPLLVLMNWFLDCKTEFFFPDIDLFGIFSQNLGIILLLQFAIAIGIGAISSFIAVRKYLKA
ncbi:MAG: permease-like cell division protein FtsX [bacterium]